MAVLTVDMRDFAGYQKGAENVEVTQRQCCTHCRCTFHKAFIETLEDLQNILL